LHQPSFDTDSRNPRGNARRALRAAFFAALAVVAALALAACGGSSSSGGSGSTSGTTSSDSTGVATAKQAVAALSAPVKFVAPGPAINVGSKLRGKTIYVVANGLNFPFVQAMLGSLKQGAQLVGAKVIAVDGAGDASKASNLVEQGVGRKVDLIVIQSFPAEQLTASLKSAKAAGIPVVEVSGRDPQSPPAALAAVGVKAIASFCYRCAGEQMAQFAVANTGGKVNSVLFDVPEIGVSKLERDGYTTELEKLCPSCKVKVVQAPLAQWTKGLPSLTTSVLQRDPGVNVLVPLYDAMVSLMEPAVAAAQASNSVQVVTYNATQPALTMLGKKNLVSGDVGGMNAWLGWATMDQIARLLSGNEPAADTKIPHRLFAAGNIASVDLTKPEPTWYGQLDLAGEYGKLWGVR
jgi:ribose transport system substrate-binding protein